MTKGLWSLKWNVLNLRTTEFYSTIEDNKLRDTIPRSSSTIEDNKLVWLRDTIPRSSVLSIKAGSLLDIIVRKKCFISLNVNKMNPFGNSCQ